MEQSEKKRLVGIGISRRGDRKFVIQSPAVLPEEKKEIIPSSPENSEVVKQMSRI